VQSSPATPRIARAISTIAWSPAAWPARSFSALNWSTSIQIAARCGTALVNGGFARSPVSGSRVTPAR
jgi:hypothetical protein